jgi:hypothetical protein
MAKQEVYWAIKHFKHDWFFDIKTSRSGAIKAFVAGGDRPWRYWYRAGYRAVKVKIEVV